MSIKLKFPKNEDVTFVQGTPVVILGANGAGKTRFGVKIEELNDKRINNNNVEDSALLVQRISAQKSLSIYDTISLLDYDSSRRAVYYGDAALHASKIGSRYGGQPATFLLDDFNKALAFLFAKNNKELEEAHIADKAAIERHEERPELITTIIETATTIWNDLLPKRKIDLTGNAVHAAKESNKYHGKEMSDGERVMLYMICQALLLPQNSVLIIDEPELHIHKAILKKLWDMLERERNDCVFVYITHDLDFAASRNTEQILWVKEYDGSNWEYEFINVGDYSSLPQELLFELIGTRKKVLFVEGERNSFDYTLYIEYFKDKDYHVIPCGGCSEVLRIYKAKKTYEALSAINAFCLIDRDFRTDEEIVSLERDGVKFLNVAEVENLFIVPALLDIIEQQLGCDAGSAGKAKQFIQDMFDSNKNNQIREAFLNEVNHQLTIRNYDDKSMTPEEIHADILEKFSEDIIKAFFEAKKLIFDAATDIDEILRVFNFKELSGKIGSKFNLHGNMEYPKRVINLLRSDTNGIRASIISALKPYIPEISNSEV